MNEFEHLKERNFQPYSPMHQAMYKCIAELLKNKPANILEVGFGIGYGLNLLKENNCCNFYWGIESDKESFNYVIDKYITDGSKCCYQNCNWLDAQPPHESMRFDFALCIEVIEHMPKEKAVEVLSKIRNYLTPTGTLFLSTPDKDTDSHGIFTRVELGRILRYAGFINIVSIEWQLPHTLFICT